MDSDLAEEHLLLSGDPPDTMCNGRFRKPKKNIPPMPQGRQIGSRDDVDVWIRIGDGTLGPLVSVMIFPDLEFPPVRELISQALFLKFRLRVSSAFGR